jgi:hypothetical protein
MHSGPCTQQQQQHADDDDGFILSLEENTIA